MNVFKQYKILEGWTYKEISEKTGLSEQVLIAIFNDKRPLKFGEEERILNAFGLHEKFKALKPVLNQLYLLEPDEIEIISKLVNKFSYDKLNLIKSKAAALGMPVL